MSAVDSSPISVLARAAERRRRNKLLQSLRAMRDNASTAYAPEDFSADIIAQRAFCGAAYLSSTAGSHSSHRAGQCRELHEVGGWTARS